MQDFCLLFEFFIKNILSAGIAEDWTENKGQENIQPKQVLLIFYTPPSMKHMGTLWCPNGCLDNC